MKSYGWSRLVFVYRIFCYVYIYMYTYTHVILFSCSFFAHCFSFPYISFHIFHFAISSLFHFSDSTFPSFYIYVYTQIVKHISATTRLYIIINGKTNLYTVNLYLRNNVLDISYYLFVLFFFFLGKYSW